MQHFVCDLKVKKDKCCGNAKDIPHEQEIIGQTKETVDPELERQKVRWRNMRGREI